MSGFDRCLERVSSSTVNLVNRSRQLVQRAGARAAARAHSIRSRLRGRRSEVQGIDGNALVGSYTSAVTCPPVPPVPQHHHATVHAAPGPSTSAVYACPPVPPHHHATVHAAPGPSTPAVNACPSVPPQHHATVHAAPGPSTSAVYACPPVPPQHHATVHAAPGPSTSAVYCCPPDPPVPQHHLANVYPAPGPFASVRNACAPVPRQHPYHLATMYPAPGPTSAAYACPPVPCVPVQPQVPGPSASAVITLPKVPRGRAEVAGVVRPSRVPYVEDPLRRKQIVMPGHVPLVERMAGYMPMASGPDQLAVLQRFVDRHTIPANQPSVDNAYPRYHTGNADYDRAVDVLRRYYPTAYANFDHYTAEEARWQIDEVGVIMHELREEEDLFADYMNARYPNGNFPQLNIQYGFDTLSNEMVLRLMELNWLVPDGFEDPCRETMEEMLEEALDMEGPQFGPEERPEEYVTSSSSSSSSSEDEEEEKMPSDFEEPDKWIPSAVRRYRDRVRAFAEFAFGDEDLAPREFGPRIRFLERKVRQLNRIELNRPANADVLRGRSITYKMISQGFVKKLDELRAMEKMFKDVGINTKQGKARMMFKFGKYNF